MDNFAYVIYRVKTQLENINYDNGDISDVGNEIGIALGQYLSTEEELNDFITGLKHGISLTNGTH
jgi:hypothetical protein